MGLLVALVYHFVQGTAHVVEEILLLVDFCIFTLTFVFVDLLIQLGLCLAMFKAMQHICTILVFLLPRHLLFLPLL